MAEEHHKAVESGEEVEVQDRGLFDFMGKKKDEERKECHEEEVLVTGVEKIHIEEGEKKESLGEKLHRSHSSSSSSSSDEEELEGENKEKKKNKKGLKGKIKEKLGCEEEEVKKPEVQVEEEEVVVVAAVVTDEDTAVVVEKVEEETVKVEFTPEEDKKGFLEKIKEKLPGHKKPAEEVPAAATPPAVPAEHGKEQEAVECHEGKEKKGILGKIMEKLPGYHKSEEKEGEKTSPSH